MHPDFSVPQGTEICCREIDRLASWILSCYPEEIGRGDPVHGESAVDVALRLLERLRKLEKVAKKAEVLVNAIRRHSYLSKEALDLAEALKELRGNDAGS